MCDKNLKIKFSVIGVIRGQPIMKNSIDRLYIHVPFCQNKCSYCAFHSVPISNTDTLVKQYLTKLEEDIKESSHLASPLQSIFIGGGTPSFLSNNDLEKLFTIISDNFTIAEQAEISIENNPESLTEEKIKIISNFANRVSIGVQSFNENHLSIIGRTGNNQSIHNIIDTFVKNNINNISIDLIYGIPIQTTKDWEKELETALELPIKHLSVYTLTFEEGTQLYSDYNAKLSKQDEITAEMWELTAEILSPKFYRYEISNYSKPGYECKHNLDIWFGGKYLGQGPTASSFDGKIRWTEQKLNRWLEYKQPDIDELPYHKRLREIFVMGLRTTYGWIIEEQQNGDVLLLAPHFKSKFIIEKQDWKVLYNKFVALNKNKLLEIDDRNSNKIKISPTPKGLLFWNEVAMEII